MRENNYAIVKKLLIEWAGQEGTITIPRIFLIILDGDYPAAVVLNQLIFWSDKGKDGWFYKTYAEWKKETGLSEYQVRRSTKFFKQKEMLETKRRKVNGAPTLHYKFSVDSFLNNLQVGTFKNFRFELEEIPDSMEPKKTTDSINSKDQKNTNNKSPHVILLEEFLEIWSQMFPKKPQPRIGNKILQKKIRSRIKEPLFIKYWQEALKRASESPTCQKQSWFHAEFFLRNSENYMKCYERWQAWQDEKITGVVEGGKEVRNYTTERTNELERLAKERENQQGQST